MKGARVKWRFGRLFRDVRNLAGLTQQEFARGLGISQGALSKIERSAMSPCAETLAQLIEFDHLGRDVRNHVADRINQFWSTKE